MPSTRTCSSCGRPFLPKRDHYHQCYGCWVRAREPLRPPTPDSALQRELDEALAEVRHWRVRAHLAEMRASIAASSPASASQFSHDELLTLRRLCHPDKHAGSEASTRMSQKVNAMLGR